MNKTILEENIVQLTENCKNIVKNYINSLIEDKDFCDYNWRNEYAFIDNLSEYKSLIRLESEKDFKIYIHPSLENNVFYFKIIPYDLSFNFDLNNNSIKFDGYIYCEYNQKLEKNEYNSQYESIRERLLNKNLELVKTEKFHDIELFLYSLD